MELGSLLLTALLERASQHVLDQPLNEVARRIIKDKGIKNAFVKAVDFAFADLQKSQFSAFTSALFDEYFISRKDISDQLLSALLIAPEVDFNYIEAEYKKYEISKKDYYSIVPVLNYFIPRVQRHAADLHDWFREYYLILLTEKNTELFRQQVSLQGDILSALNRINVKTLEPDLDRLPGINLPSPRCRAMWGRDDFIKDNIALMIENKTPYVMAFTGGPGYGKTELARRFAEIAFAEESFNDVFWVKARKADFFNNWESEETTRREKQMTRAEIIDELSKQLHCPKKITPQLLRRERYLVVIDNAEDVNIPEALSLVSEVIKPTKVLITSRFSIENPIIHSIDVPGLDFISSRTLLMDEAKHRKIEEILNASEKQIKEVHRLTCGAPLALHFVIGRVANDISIEPVLNDLELANKHVNAFYKFCLETAWNNIGQEAKGVLRYMGHLTEDQVTTSELMGTLKISSNDLNSAIRELTKWHLIEARRSAEDNRLIDLHPWIRNSIRSKLVDTWEPTNIDIQDAINWKTSHLSKWN